MTTPETRHKPHLLLRAARGERLERVPVWLMRQAGRYLSEYREIRAKHAFLEVVKSPDLAAEVSLQPWRFFGMDAIIMFSDILTPLEGMGIPFRLDEGGPKITSPIRTRADVEKVHAADPTESVPYVLDLLRILKREAGGEVPVLGFAGAPFTLATYAVGEGRRAKESAVKTLAYEDPAALHALLAKLAEQTASYLAAQVAAGADAVQLFDTWAGELSPRDYRELALPYQQAAIQPVLGQVPVILYVLGGTPYLDLLAATGADVVSLDWRADLRETRQALGRSVALQGNLDPAVLYGPPETVRSRVLETLESLGGIGHIFNLGHGLLPTTPRESVALLVETVKAWRPGGAASGGAGEPARP